MESNSEYDWKGIAEDYQRENENLREQIADLKLGKFTLDDVKYTGQRLMSFLESHPVAAIVIVYVIFLVIGKLFWRD